MKIADAFTRVRRVYVETAPLIYYVEENSAYVERMDAVVLLIDGVALEAVSSVITLTEVLNQPIKLGRTDLERAYRDILMNSGGLRMPLHSFVLAMPCARRMRCMLRQRFKQAAISF